MTPRAVAQSAGGGAMRPGGGAGVGLVPQPAGVGGMSDVPPADGGGGASGGAGASGGPAPAGSCAGFMACTPPHQGHGAMISYTVTPAPEVADLPIDHVRITLKIAGEAVSWSPITLPEFGGTLTWPLVTPMFQSCPTAYGEAVSTVEGLAGGEVVAHAGGTFIAEDCVMYSIPVELQLVTTDDEPSGAAGSAAGATAGSSGAVAGGSAVDAGAVTDAGPDAPADGADDDSGCAAAGSRADHAGWVAPALLALLAVTHRRRRCARASGAR